VRRTIASHDSSPPYRELFAVVSAFGVPLKELAAFFCEKELASCAGVSYLKYKQHACTNASSGRKTTVH
jgi:hypothetical protein